MFDSVRNNKKIVQVFLALITLPFAFFGVDSYVRNSGAGRDMASVGDTKISVQQFEQAMRERQDQMRQALGASFRSEIMNTPEVRRSVLNSLVDQRLLLLEASKGRLATSDVALRDVIGKIPSLQVDGQFSMERYESALRAQGMSQPQFEAKLRQDLTLQQLIGAVGETAFVSDAQAEKLLQLQLEERQYSSLTIAPTQFSGKVSLEASAVQKYYDDNKAQFEEPEQVKAEYLVLSQEALQAQVSVSDAEIKAWYDGHKDRYVQPEERRVSHILLSTEGDAGKDKAGVQMKAESVLKEVQAAPAKFAELAKKYSQDSGSAKNGGDLGFFGRGMMDKAFEDAAFGLADGEISGLVQTDYGFHIIKLDGIKPAKQRPLDEVRAEIETELKNQAATRKFAEAAENFTNLVYEQADSLQPAAEKYDLKIQQSGWLPKDPDPKQVAALGLLGNPRVLTALFASDAVKNKRNTEAVEVAASTLLAARVVEHRPAALKPFDTVQADIRKQLAAEAEATMAKSDGETKLTDLQAGNDKLTWSAVKTMSRMKAAELPLPALKAIFRADVEKLPAYAGAQIDGSYVLYKVVKVTPPEKVDADMRKRLQAEYGSIIAQQDLAAYLSSLRSRYKLSINQALLEKER